jgi:hypothetical protein
MIPAGALAVVKTRRHTMHRVVGVVGLCLVAWGGSVYAAEPSNPSPPPPQPIGAPRWLTPWELHMLRTYRLVELTRLGVLEFPGGATAGPGGEAAAGAATGGGHGHGTH